MKKSISPEATMSVGFLMVVQAQIFQGVIPNMISLGGWIILITGIINWRRAKKKNGTHL